MKRKLGKSGIEVSAMGLDCWAIGGPYKRTSDGEEFAQMGWGDPVHRFCIFSTWLGPGRNSHGVLIWSFPAP